jgi:hypothetical protein
MLLLSYFHRSTTTEPLAAADIQLMPELHQQTTAAEAVIADNVIEQYAAVGACTHLGLAKGPTLLAQRGTASACLYSPSN